MRGFVRGLLNINGDSRNIPTNAVDDVPAYALLNLYAGVRDADGRWEVTAYGKNIFNTFRVLSREAGAAAINVRDTLAASTTSQNSNYRLITTTAPREFGLTAKFSFGSR
jgi:iron complex outermembrane receptor protein